MRLRHLALPAAAGLTLLALPFAPTAVAPTSYCETGANSCAVRFDFTGSAQSFTVPAGVSNLIAVVGGASGGDGLDVDRVVPEGGRGGGVEVIVPVTPGQVLTLVVGGKGGDAVLTDEGDTPPPPAAGGYGGGGAGTSALDGPVGGGGGGSFLYAGDTLLVAAGGGGGAGYTGFGDTTADGGTGSSGNGSAAAGADGGGGATSSAGGAAGGGEDSSAGSGPATGPAKVGAGGAAAGTCSAGGGGGGYFGGGSGGCTYIPVDVARSTGKAGAAKARTGAATDAAPAAPAAATQRIQYSGGGGGGAGFLGAGVSKIADLDPATSELDDGVIAIGYTTAATTTTLTSDVTTLAPGQEASLDATVDGPDLTIGTPSDADSPAGKTAAAALGASRAKALAVPTQPVAPGTTINPGTACGSIPCTVTFFVNGTQLGDPITVDAATGVASVIFTAGSDQGVREITARYDGNLYYLQSTSDPLSLTVAGLANTGPSNVGPMLGASAALLAVGAGLVVFGRRRPQLGSHRAA